MNSARDVLANIGWIGNEGAETVLSALAAAGMVVVPREPTEAMLRAGRAAWWRKFKDMGQPQPTEHPDDGGGPAGYAYRAMLAAAQEGAP